MPDSKDDKQRKLVVFDKAILYFGIVVLIVTLLTFLLKWWLAN
ncbi:hypothetical protein [Kurthia sibirica]|nr:hypothetical protein [Kurthia sibirica]GEK33288.1 hypothetical protein KSI01_08210 [Kurthia sibirica]